MSTATDYLKIFFSGVSADYVSLRDIYLAAGKNLDEEDKNRTWLRNKMIYMKRLNLIEPVYEKKGNFDMLVGVKITDDGKKALIKQPSLKSGSISKISAVEKVHHSPTAYFRGDRDINTLEDRIQTGMPLEGVLRVIAKMSEENPKVKISYSVKDEVISVEQVRG